jgi:hypothetical protein
MKDKQFDFVFITKQIIMKNIITVRLYRVLACLSAGAIFQITAGKTILNWEFWAFVVCLGTYGFLSRVEGRKEATMSEEELSAAVTRIQADIRRKAKIQQLIDNGTFDEQRDAILDKISLTGIESLSLDEKEFLKQVSVK